jgi:ribonuclease HI
MRVELFTDGSSRGCVGDGGWAYLLRYGTHTRQRAGYMPDTTNQRMELIAPIMGLRALKKPMPVTIYTDSAYVMNAFVQGWIKKWEGNGWMAGGRRPHPVENRDCWEALIEEVAKHHVEWKKLKGHSGHVENDIVDQLAVAAKNAGMQSYVEVDLPSTQLALA